MKLKYDLRKWQLEALREWKTSHQGIVEVITGGGKTVFAEACILELLSSRPDAKILIIVPTIVLLDQWYLNIIEELGANEKEISLYGGGRKAKNTSLINIAVVNTARKLTPEITEEGNWFLIVDECHRVASKSNRNALEGKFIASLGLSATPERQYDNNMQEYVIPVLGEIIFRYGLEEAYKDGVVTNFDLINVEIPLLEDEEKEVNRLTKYIGQLSKKDTETAKKKLEVVLRKRARVVNNATMRIPSTVKIVEMNKGKRMMIFHEDISVANKLLSILKKKNFSVTIYHTKIGAATRLSNLFLFKKGIFEIIIACRALDEGINIPETEIGIIAASTATTRQRIQRLGRILRPSIKKQKSTIYSLYASEPEKDRLSKEFYELKSLIDIKWLKVNVPS